MKLIAAVWSGVKCCWHQLKRNKDQLTILFVLFGGFWALKEYSDAQKTEKRAETIRYIDRYHGEAYLSTRSAMNKVLFDRNKQTQFLDARGDTAKLEKFVWSNQLAGHILSLTELYDSLVRCVHAEVCDKEIACTYFASDINAFHNTFRPLFAGIWTQMWGEDFMERPAKFANECLKTTR